MRQDRGNIHAAGSVRVRRPMEARFLAAEVRPFAGGSRHLEHIPLPGLPAPGRRGMARDFPGRGDDARHPPRRGRAPQAGLLHAHALLQGPGSGRSRVTLQGYRGEVRGAGLQRERGQLRGRVLRQGRHGLRDIRPGGDEPQEDSHDQVPRGGRQRGPGHPRHVRAGLQVQGGHGGEVLRQPRLQSLLLPGHQDLHLRDMGAAGTDSPEPLHPLGQRHPLPGGGPGPGGAEGKRAHRQDAPHRGGAERALRSPGPSRRRGREASRTGHSLPPRWRRE